MSSATRSWLCPWLLACALAAGCDGELPLLASGPALGADGPADFGAPYVGATVELPLAVENAGSAAATSLAWTVEGEGYALLEAPELIAVGATAAARVAFTPVAEGSSVGALTVRDELETLLRVELRGSGTAWPECAPSSDCLAIRFDPEAGACVGTARDGPCDDDNACTTDTRCVGGACVGEAVVCDDPDTECGVGYCDREQGCIVIDDDGRCDDDNPCTEDRCVEGACERDVIADGTACGPWTGCELAMCRAGACEITVAPDGFACVDDDPCTQEEQCSGGACVGTDVIGGPPISLARWDALYTNDTKVAVLNDGRVVLVRSPRAWSSPRVDDAPLHVGDRPALVTVLALHDDELAPVAQTPLDTLGPVDEVWPFREGFVVRSENADTYTYVGVDSDGVAVALSALVSILPAADVSLRAASSEQGLFVCTSGVVDDAPVSRIYRMDFTYDAGFSIVDATEVAHACRSISVDDPRARVIVTDDDAAWAYAFADLSSPPVLIGAPPFDMHRFTSGVVAGDYYVATVGQGWEGTDGASPEESFAVWRYPLDGDDASGLPLGTARSIDGVVGDAILIENIGGSWQLMPTVPSGTPALLLPYVGMRLLGATGTMMVVSERDAIMRVLDVALWPPTELAVHPAIAPTGPLLVNQSTPYVVDYHGFRTVDPGAPWLFDGASPRLGSFTVTLYATKASGGEVEVRHPAEAFGGGLIDDLATLYNARADLPFRWVLTDTVGASDVAYQVADPTGEREYEGMLAPVDSGLVLVGDLAAEPTLSFLALDDGPIPVEVGSSEVALSWTEEVGLLAPNLVDAFGQPWGWRVVSAGDLVAIASGATSEVALNILGIHADVPPVPVFSINLTVPEGALELAAIEGEHLLFRSVTPSDLEDPYEVILFRYDTEGQTVEELGRVPEYFTRVLLWEPPWLYLHGLSEILVLNTEGGLTLHGRVPMPGEARGQAVALEGGALIMGSASAAIVQPTCEP